MKHPPETKPAAATDRFRTIWISDSHLGARGSQSGKLLEFLEGHDSEKLYVVGDFVDLWQLRRTRRWPEDHNDIIQSLLTKARQGTQIIYIPGNHDDFCLNFVGDYGRVRIVENDIHVTAEGKRLLVLHGHEFDSVTKHARWIAVIGDIGYNFLLKLNYVINFFRRIFGREHWSLSSYVKRKVKSAVNVVSNFEEMVAKYAQMHDARGIVCGHIHTPSIREIRGIEYYNTGDWVESCTALVEHDDGRMELIYWLKRQAQAGSAEGPVVPAQNAASADSKAV